MTHAIKLQLYVRCNHRDCDAATSIVLPVAAMLAGPKPSATLRATARERLAAKRWELIAWHGAWFAFCPQHRNKEG